jgi:hypothetical protein
VICDESLGMFNFGWHPCDKKLCEHHFAGDSRCHSLPETNCEKTFKVARTKKRIVQSILLIFLLGLIFSAVLIIVDVMKPVSKYTS